MLKITPELAIESGCCKQRVDEIASLIGTQLQIPIKDGELHFLLRAISWSAYKSGFRNLSGADLSGADLREADLRWANLSEANLRWANLSGANLREAIGLTDGQ